MISKSNARSGIDQKAALNAVWRSEMENGSLNQQFRKRFIGCKCPKCGRYHEVCMVWVGRGMPRKYCAICRNVVSRYDDAVIFEASGISQRFQGRKKPNAAFD